LRRFSLWAAALLLLPVLLLAGLLLALPRIELGAFAAGRLSSALGREVTVGSARLAPGRWTRVELTDVRLGNLPGEAEPMLEIARAVAEVETRSLLGDVLAIRGAGVEGARLRLGRDGSGRGNWVFGEPAPEGVPEGAPEGASTGEPGLTRANFPSLRDLALAGSEVTYRTGSGKLLRVRIDRGRVAAPAEDARARLELEGAYNDAPVTLGADLGTLIELRDTSKPYPAVLDFASGDTRLRFEGGFTRPLDVDGADGRLVLDAPALTDILRIAGAEGEARPALALDGHLTREGDLWVLERATGRLGRAEITEAMLRLKEGARGQEDEVETDLAFARLDLDSLLGAGGESGGESGGDADVALAPDRDPGVRLKARLAAREVVYAGYQASAARAEAELLPGRIAVPSLAFTYLGGRFEGNATVEAAEEGPRGTLSADARVSGLGLDRLKRTLGLGSLPLSGEIAGAASIRAEGETLNAAARAARASAVIRMEGGSVSREAIELLSTDIAGLFRSSDARTNVACLLAVVDVRGGVGTVSPLRLRTGEGTIAGAGRFDLGRETVDLTIASEARTTGALALDVPIRVRGSFSDPSIGPGGWPRSGPPSLRAGISRLIPSLQPAARGSPCLDR